MDLSSASLGTHRWSLEGQPQEEYPEWAAGRADECEATWGRGPGRASGDTAEDAGAGNTGQMRPNHINPVKLISSFDNHFNLHFQILSFSVLLMSFIIDNYKYTLVWTLLKSEVDQEFV